MHDYESESIKQLEKTQEYVSLVLKDHEQVKAYNTAKEEEEKIERMDTLIDIPRISGMWLKEPSIEKRIPI